MIDPDLVVYLAAAGVFKDGKPDREFFLAEVERSRRAVEFGKAELAREFEEVDDELQRILGDHD